MKPIQFKVADVVHEKLVSLAKKKDCTIADYMRDLTEKSLISKPETHPKCKECSYITLATTFQNSNTCLKTKLTVVDPGKFYCCSFDKISKLA
jgi:hypothetical protein